MKNKRSIYKVAPVLFGFFIMGFCDLVGVSVTYAKDHFNWTETQAGFLPSMVFIWFLIISIPTSLTMYKFGRKNISLMGMFFTFIGMLLPFIIFNETTCYIAFALLGIGNTILQVSLNPLLTNVIHGDKLSSAMTAGQFVKALSSFVGPLIAGFCSLYLNDWVQMFPIFAFITFISGLWLFFTKINETEQNVKPSGFRGILKLLSDKTILLLFLGIVAIVGLDVGMNVMTPKLLIEKADMTKEAASLGTSWYFAARTIGTVCGVILLAKFSESKYFRINMLVVIVMVTLLFIADSQLFIISLVCIIAFAASSIFAIIYSLAIRSLPNKANEISGLMITGVSGGALIPPLMGFSADAVGNQSGSVFIILICSVYLAFCSFRKFSHSK